ncbi:MAG: flagellar hook-associated protein FlgK, partial [Lachnospiraceae bacterium]|nr:flagellar hook-associated protein FlgK [Lachnospiraceae bacterium]
MPSTFFGLNIAASGMATYNAGLNTTGHNISNIRTEGYSRQRVVQKATDALSLRTSYGMMGTGVQATDIVNDRSEYYDTRFRQATGVYQKYVTESYYLESVENYFYPKEESSGSVANSLTNFFTSLSYLTTSPMDATIRTNITGYAGTLAYYAEQTAIQLQTLQSEVNMEIEATVKQINAYAEQLSSLTKQINAIEVYDQTANDLRDQRALIVDKLSALADVTVTEKAPADGNGTNQYVVTLGGGVLV